MKQDNREAKLERRELLKVAGLAGVGAAAALPAQAQDGPDVEESPAEQIKPRYRETAHVLRFYALNRL